MEDTGPRFIHVVKYPVNDIGNLPVIHVAQHAVDDAPCMIYFPVFHPGKHTAAVKQLLLNLPDISGQYRRYAFPFFDPEPEGCDDELR